MMRGERRSPQADELIKRMKASQEERADQPKAVERQEDENERAFSFHEVIGDVEVNVDWVENVRAAEEDSEELGNYEVNLPNASDIGKMTVVLGMDRATAEEMAGKAVELANQGMNSDQVHDQLQEHSDELDIADQAINMSDTDLLKEIERHSGADKAESKYHQLRRRALMKEVQTRGLEVE